MSTPNIIRDNGILWLEIALEGTPAEWQPGTNYHVGDTVVPRSTFSVPVGKENSMFQCIGFVGMSASSEPTWPAVLGNTVVDNEIEWKTRSENPSSVNVDAEEYYHVNHTLVLN